MTTKQLEAAQTAKRYLMNKHIYDRINHVGNALCVICKAAPGQLHLIDCPEEQCPVCSKKNFDCMCMEVK